MSPATQICNGKIATSVDISSDVVAASNPTATTKPLKLQKNARGIVGAPQTILGGGRLSSLAATLPLTSLTKAADATSSNSSLVCEQQEVTLRPTLQQQNLVATATTTSNAGQNTETVNEIAKQSCRNNNINNNNKVYTTTTTKSPSFKIMSYQQSIFALLAVLLCGLVGVDGLKCQMCGQYNEGVGSITPCLNYSEANAHLYLKECSKKSEKYCVKYVSELSIVRDCATECSEKEIWETQTYCCTEDGCNGASNMEFSTMVLMLPIVVYICQAVWNVIKEQKRR